MKKIVKLPTKRNEFRTKFGVRVHNHRRVRRITLQQLARRTGISVSMLSQIERGRSLPNILDGLTLIAELNLTTEGLI